MHMFLFLKSFFLVSMAGQKKLRVIAFVGAVANTASSDRNRAVDIFPLHQPLVVAIEAQIPSLGP